METEKQEVSVGVVGRDQRLIVQFSDGQFAIPEFALDVLGGKENLIKILPDLRHKSFGDFLSAVHVVATKQELNKLQAILMSDHLGVRSV